MDGIGIGILIGVGIASLKGAVRPIAKGAIKFGIFAAAALKSAFHEGQETLADLLAEVKQEIEAEPVAARRKPEPPPVGIN